MRRSHNYGKGLAKECAWVGTRDYSAFLAVPEALKFVEEVCVCAYVCSANGSPSPCSC